MSVQIEQHLNQRPLQSRAPVCVEQKAAAGKVLSPAQKSTNLSDSQSSTCDFGLKAKTAFSHEPAPPDCPPPFCQSSPIRAANSAGAASIDLVPPRLPTPACPALRYGHPTRASPPSSPQPRRFSSAPISAPISFDARFRRALSVSTSASNFRRCSSSLSNSSMQASSPAPRVARRWRTKSGWSRINLISSTGGL